MHYDVKIMVPINKEKLKPEVITVKSISYTFLNMIHFLSKENLLHYSEMGFKTVNLSIIRVNLHCL